MIAWRVGQPPDDIGVYHVRVKGEVVYVGMAERLLMRYRGHRFSPWYRMMVRMGVEFEWFYHVVPLTVSRMGEQADLRDAVKRALELESRLILEMKPSLNRSKRRLNSWQKPLPPTAEPSRDFGSNNILVNGVVR